MELLNKLNLKKNTPTIMVAVALLVYLYLDTPVPASLVLNKYLLFLAYFLIVVTCYNLLNKVNVFLILLFALVAVEIVRKSSQPDLHSIDKKLAYYDNLMPTNSKVISDKLQQDTNLEQEMVNLMKVTSEANDFPRSSPRYQPIAPSLAGLAQIE